MAVLIAMLLCCIPTAAAATDVKPKAEADAFVTDGLLGHFTWTIDLASGVDLTSHDMTNLEISAAFGGKWKAVRFLGAGTGIISMMNNSSHSYPVFAMLRTSFTPEKRTCFLEAKGGVAFTTLEGYKMQTNPYASIGVGFTLAHSRKFSSHIIVRYAAIPLSTLTTPDGSHASGYLLSFANIGIGCAF